MHVNLLRKSNAGSGLRSRPGTGFLFPLRGGIPPRLGYRAIRGDQRKRLMKAAFPLADPSISGQLPVSRVIGHLLLVLSTHLGTGTYLFTLRDPAVYRGGWGEHLVKENRGSYFASVEG